MMVLKIIPDAKDIGVLRFPNKNVINNVNKKGDKNEQSNCKS